MREVDFRDVETQDDLDQFEIIKYFTPNYLWSIRGGGPVLTVFTRNYREFALPSHWIFNMDFEWNNIIDDIDGMEWRDDLGRYYFCTKHWLFDSNIIKLEHCV